MPLFFPFCRERWFVLLFTLIALLVAGRSYGAGEWTGALQTLSRVDAGRATQADAQTAWQVVAAQGTAEQIPTILAAMRDVGPLAENWLRAAVDTIAERQLQANGSLPIERLEVFVLDKTQPPRGRRIAYEWLAKVDATIPERLLPQMLDDPSLELRYDAIERLLAKAKKSSDLPTESVESYRFEKYQRVEKYQRALRSARDKSQLRRCAEALKELGKAPNMAEQMGFLTAWKVIGPFDNTGRSGFDNVYPPEHKVDFDAVHKGKSGPVKWTDAVAEPEDLDEIGKVDLNKALGEEKSVLAYAVATFVAVKNLQVECRYETLEATKLWVNGEQLAARNIYHSGGGLDQYIVSCRLHRGENQILIKVCQNEQTESWTKPWDFRLRVTDKLGGAVALVKE